MYFVATFIHHVNAILLATDVDEGCLVAKGRLRQRVPAVTTLQGDFQLLSICTIQTFVVRFFLARSTEVLGTATAPNSVLGAVLGSLLGHLFAIIAILGIVVWLGGLEGKDFVAADALDDVVADEQVRLLVTDFLEHLLAEIFAKIFRLHQGIALAAATVSKVTRWQLREQCLLGVGLKALQVELMEAAVGEEHAHLSFLLLLLGELSEAVDARRHIVERGRHIEVFFLFFLVSLGMGSSWHSSSH